MRKLLSVLLCLMMVCVCLSADAAGKTETDPVPVSVRDAEGKQFSCHIVCLGYTVSQIQVGNVTLSVPTEDLLWDTNAESGKRVAAIYAPNKGQVSVRKTEKPKSRIMDHADTNCLVRVVSVGKQTTGIVFGNRVSYVLNSALTYPKKLSAVGMGTVVENGRDDGLRTVTIYMKNSTSSRKVAEVPTGTEATIYSITKKWMEVDAGGWHGYIKTENIAWNEEELPTTLAAGSISAAQAAAPASSFSDEDEDDDLEAFDGEYVATPRTEIDQDLIDEEDWDDEEVDTRGYYR